MASGSKITWRVRGLDLCCNDACLRQLLDAQPGLCGVRIQSRAIEHHGRSQTATVSLVDGATPLQSLGSCQDHGDPDEKLLPDDQFLGFTTLFMPPKEDHLLDIVAISGLGSHAFGSFKERGGEHMWLRDALPKHLVGQETKRPMARIMIYGYESRVANSTNFQNMDDIARVFRHRLAAVASDTCQLPIVVIAHSLGGLVFKEALISLAKKKENEDSQELLRAISGVVFFGVPHQGMDTASLLPMADMNNNLALILSISQNNSQFLTRQSREFPRALNTLRRREVFCFYETEMSQTAMKVNGNWEMTGQKAILVSTESATHCVPAEDRDDHICAISRPHSSIVKYSRQDDVYDELVLPRLRGIAKRAIRHVAQQTSPGGRDGQAAISTRQALNDTALSLLTGRSNAHQYNAIEPDRDSAPKVMIMIPMRKNSSFTGRKFVLEELQQALFPEKRDQAGRPILALVGLGGVGKTQVVLELSYWVKQHKPEYSIFWISAMSIETFEQSCADIIRKLGLTTNNKESRDVKKQMEEYLSGDPRAGKWLLVLDNADDVSLLEDTLTRYLPSSDSGITLITTGTKDAALTMVSSRDIVNLALPDEEEAQLLLENSFDTQKVPDYSKDMSRKLLKALERLPLAITHAAAYLDRNQISIEQYLSHLQGHWKEAEQLLSRKFSPMQKWPLERQQYAVITTWLVSLDQIRHRDEAHGNRNATVELLMFLSQIGPKAIPKSMLPIPCGSAEMLTNIIGTLLGYAFLTKGDADVYDMHSLVHLAVRSWVSRERLSDEATRASLTHLHRLVKLEGGTLAWAVATAYMPHVLRLLTASDAHAVKTRFLLASWMSDCLEQDGQIDESLKWTVVYAEGIAALHSATCGERLVARFTLAHSYIRARQPAAALSILSHTIDVLSQESDSAIAELLPIHRLHLGVAHSIIGQHSLAITTIQIVLISLPHDNSDEIYLHAQRCLVQAFLDSGQAERALEPAERLAAILRDTLPEEDSDRVETEMSLAIAYLGTGQPQRALPIVKYVVAERERSLRPGHPDLLASHFLLGKAHLETGKPALAVSLFEHVTSHWSNAPPLDAVNHKLALKNLVKAYLAIDELQKALVAFNQFVQLSLQLSEAERERLLECLLLVQDYHRIAGAISDGLQQKVNEEIRSILRTALELDTEDSFSSTDDK
ncbi:protein SERAC1 [Microdochium nivale]|nr:protein SERAC1 [Microdochium nivale]